MKKLFTLILVFIMLVVMLLPVTALASNEEPQATADGATQQATGSLERKRIKDAEESTDTSPGETDGIISDMSLSSVGPIKYTKPTKYYDDELECYWTYYTYTAPKTGSYTFYCLTDSDNQILIYKGDDEIENSVDGASAPFAEWAYMEKGKKYYIYLLSYDYEDYIKYLMSTPVTLGTSAYKIKSNGYSYEWLQAFDFTLTTDRSCSFYFDNSYDYGNVSLYLWEGDNPDDLQEIDDHNIVTKDFYINDLSPGKYHVILVLENADSKSDTFTVAMDSISLTTIMEEGTTVTSKLSTNDILTMNVFNPETTGEYNLACSRSDAKVSVISGSGSIIGTDPGRGFTLTAGTNYGIYFVTKGTSGTMTYSAEFIPSEECGFTPSAPLSLDGNVVYATVGSSAPQVIAGTASQYATWALYSDNACTTEITNKTITLSEGINRAYIKVTAQDGIHTAIYPVLIYLTGLADPVIVVYDADYNEVGNDDVLHGPVRVKMLGNAGLVQNILRGDDAYTLSGSEIPEEGDYRILLSDYRGGAANIEFTIDNTKPVITAESSETPISTGALCNNGVEVTVTEAHTGTNTATKDGTSIEWPDDGTFIDDGVYVINAMDAAKNSSTFSFTIDQSGPVINAVCGTTTLDNDDHAKSDVTVTVTDPHFKGKSVTKNGMSMTWPSKNKFTSAGTYTVTTADTLNNTSTFTFTIDKTLPVITAKYSGKYTVSNNSCLKYDVTVTVSDANFDTKAVTRNTESYTWPDTSIFTEEGKYVITVKDKAGNTVSLTFTIDKTQPSIIAANGEGVLPGGANVNTNVTVSVTDINLSSKSVKKSGSTIKWPSGDMFTSSGSYVVTAKDKAGNTSTFSFVIDKTPPSISVKTTSGKTVKNAAVTKYDVYVKVSDSYLVTKGITRNGVPVDTWPSKGKFTLEGEYVVTAKDKAGNTSTYSFTLDKPALFSVTAGEPAAALANNAHTPYTVTIGYTEQFFASKTLKKDGIVIAWPESNQVSDEGVYTASVKDSIGNTSAFTFTIDNTAPVITAKAASGAAVANGGTTNESKVTITITDKYYASKTVTKNGTAMSWPSYSRFTAEGVYVITATDKAGNVTTFTFTIDR